MSSSKARNIIFVAGIHGNEQMPVKALRDHHIPFVFGNPKAYETNVRFTEGDLNASFGTEGTHFEAMRAKEILEEISTDSLVVDFHTTGAVTSPFAIVVDEKFIPFAATTGLEHVVIMKHNIKEGHALINYRDGISIEAGHHDTEESYATALAVVKNVQAGIAFSVKVYEVYDKIIEPGEYTNFTEHPNGFISVLAGEPAYDFYGLKARRIS